MTIELMSYIQLGAMLTYIGSVFFIYTILGKQKDATIETLKTRIELLAHQLELAQSNTPDVAVEAYANRVTRVTEELGRLRTDNDVSAEIIAAKVKELEIANSDLEDLRKQVNRAEVRLAEFYCPLCAAPMETKDTDMRGEMINGEPLLQFYDVTYFVCGCELVNGEVTRKCDDPN
jgi:hypothetical protein